MGFKNFFSGISNEFMRIGDDMKKFQSLFPDHSFTDLENFCTITRAGKEIEKQYGFDEFPSNSIRSHFSSAEEEVFRAYERRFEDPHPVDMYYTVRKIEDKYGRRF